MPISQITVLALYGELYNLVVSIEAAQLESANLDEYQTLELVVTERRKIIHDLRMKAHRAQAQAIGVITEDAPQITVNPITGEAS